MLPSHDDADPPTSSEPLAAATAYSVEDFFGGALFVYTRADALADGTLVDVSTTAREAGFLLPVAVTQTLWADLHDIPVRSGQDIDGRLWDLLNVARAFIAQAVAEGRGDTSHMLFEFHLARPGFPDRCHVKSVIGPGDDGKPALTFMQPGED